MRSITDKLPLRDSTVWDAYREARAIPHRYGECGGAPIQYDSSRRLWVWADHASLAIDRVLVDGLPVTNWQWRNAVDSTGHPVTMVEFADAIEESANVVVRGRAKMNAVSGALIENAADVLYDLLVNVAGLPYAAARFENLRAAAADLPVGGSVEAAEPTFAIARALCASIGAVFSPDLIDLALLYPGAAGLVRVDVRRDRDIAVEANCRRSDLCNDLTIRYAIEAGSPRGAVQYEAPASIARAGRLPLVLDAPWVTSGRVAAAVVERVLGLRARRRWNVTASNVVGDVRVGTFVRLDHPLLPGVVGEFLVEACEYDEQTNRSTITFVAPAEDFLELHFLRNTLASSAIEPISASASLSNNEYGFVVVDEENRPVSGATCVLDPGGVNLPRRSDSSGWVSWPRHAMTPGQHTVVVTFDGRTLTILLQVP